MITGTGGLLLYLWILLGFSVVAIALTVGLMQARLFEIIERFSLPVRHALLWFLAILPYVAGLYIAVLTLVPSFEHVLGLSLDHCHLHGKDHGHLCWAHPPVFILMSWQGFSAFLFAALIAWSLGKTLFRALRHHRYSKLLTSLAELRHGVHQLESDIPSAFTLGLFRPRVLVSSALTESLNADEMAVVHRHEFAHQIKRDPLRLWLFSGLLGVFLPGVARRFYQAMELTLEQIADATVAAEIKDPLFIAETLVKVNRLTARFLTSEPSFGACHFSGTPLEQRIFQLLNDTHYAGFPQLKFIVCILVAVGLSLGGADATHHFIENILHSPAILFSH
ncbi:MAG: hypothetical protein EOO52_05095 [Gammaproteobacteria bacterium]|nr:MAG: hypothetical protein EOO52_05095 [Gammaproteobacteria bacterium]